MQRAVGLVGVAIVCGCGPTVDGGAGSGSASGESSTGTSTSTSTGTSTTIASVGDVTSDGGSSESTTGEDWAVPPESTLATVDCAPDGDTEITRLYVEAFRVPDALSDCAPRPDLGADQLVQIAMTPWDGLGGVFEVGADVQASIGLSAGPPTGTIEIVVAAPYEATLMHVDMHTDDDEVVGTLDLSGCWSAMPC